MKPHNIKKLIINVGLPWCSDSKESAYNAGDPGSISESGRCPREANSYPCQYSCLDISIDRRTWWATVHMVANSEHN